MSEWERNGWVLAHTSSRQEIGDLLSIADRDLKDAREKGTSADCRFRVAYNDALNLCTAILHAAGYRPAHTSAHFRTLASLPLLLGTSREEDANYLEACRRKRNSVEQLRVDVRRWLKENHPNLV